MLMTGRGREAQDPISGRDLPPAGATATMCAAR